MKPLTKDFRPVLIISMLLLFALGLFVYNNSNFDHYRGIRGAISFVTLFTLLLYQRSKINIHISLFLLLYGASSIITIWYENNSMAILAMFLNSVAFVSLILYLWPKVDFKKMNFWLGAIFIILALVNAYLIYELLVMIKDFSLSDFHYIFIWISTASLMLTGFMSLLYNYKYSTLPTLIFTIFIFLIVFSEVFRAIAYYDITYAGLAVHIARILLILGIYFLANYAFLIKRPLPIKNSEIEKAETSGKTE